MSANPLHRPAWHRMQFSLRNALLWLALIGVNCAVLRVLVGSGARWTEVPYLLLLLLDLHLLSMFVVRQSQPALAFDAAISLLIAAVLLFQLHEIQLNAPPPQPHNSRSPPWRDTSGSGLFDAPNSAEFAELRRSR